MPIHDMVTEICGHTGAWLAVWEEVRCGERTNHFDPEEMVDFFALSARRIFVQGDAWIMRLHSLHMCRFRLSACRTEIRPHLRGRGPPQYLQAHWAAQRGGAPLCRSRASCAGR
eukprot:GHVU01218293.1.p4 GENE.GHVU01218293.1~~GHVU01218293.1.p4  ORF type:complete len:114 (-),score=5.06 GHVU01218293.1:1804-2145(-)